MIVRTRFAPSPTGYLHVGGARTALFNWLFARHSSGSFTLRIEDTDIERSDRVFENAIMEDLRWLGLEWDEGPDKGGKKGPYRQSERLSIYLEYSKRLLKEDKAYKCYCTKERLEELKREQLKAGLPPRYDGRCRDLKSAPDTAPSIRFKVFAREVSFDDKVHGNVSFDAGDMGDFIIVDSGGSAAYNFAVVLDDALMDITHVIRGDDHLSNTPRQILLYEALGLKVPEYFHLPLIVSSDKTPLGKRVKSASVRVLREEGFLPEAILNLLSRLGWSHGEDFLELDEMAEKFTAENLSKSPSVFDIERLKKFNKEAIKRASNDRLLNLVSIPEQEGLSKNRRRDAVDAVKNNAETLKDIPDLVKPFTGEVTFTVEALAVLREPHAKDIISALMKMVEGAGELNEASYNGIIKGLKDLTDQKGKALFMPIRAALTGRTTGIELEKVFSLLGKERITERLKEALK